MMRSSIELRDRVIRTLRLHLSKTISSRSVVRPVMVLGLGYGWSKGRSDWLGRDHYLSWGSLMRPLRQLSVGAAASYGLDEGDYRGIAMSASDRSGQTS